MPLAPLQCMIKPFAHAGKCQTAYAGWLLPAHQWLLGHYCCLAPRQEDAVPRLRAPRHALPLLLPLPLPLWLPLLLLHRRWLHRRTHLQIGGVGGWASS